MLAFGRAGHDLANTMPCASGPRSAASWVEPEFTAMKVVFSRVLRALAISLP
jgi:hypothetical protein